jgi:phospholipid/cholesterol/gamma-HCH transport system ATP-binding protein
VTAATSAGTREDTTILHFDACLLPLVDAAGEVFEVKLSLRPGDLVLLQIEDSHHEEAVSRAACGLLAPLEGRVTFLNRDWMGLAPDWSNATRGRIGVVFRQDNWIPYLSLMENIILPQLHHTRSPLGDICEEAAHWASHFGLPGLPRDLPAAASPQDRQAANLVRAFAGDPSLVIIEHLPAPPSAGLLQTLVNAIRDLRERGAAVLWLTQDMALNRNASIPATGRLRLGGSWNGAGRTQGEAVA